MFYNNVIILSIVYELLGNIVWYPLFVSNSEWIFIRKWIDSSPPWYFVLNHSIHSMRLMKGSLNKSEWLCLSFHLILESLIKHTSNILELDSIIGIEYTFLLSLVFVLIIRVNVDYKSALSLTNIKY